MKDKGSALRNAHLLNRIDSNVDAGVAEIHNRIEILETRMDEWFETLVEALGIIHGDVEQMRDLAATKRDELQRSNRNSLQGNSGPTEQQRELLTFELSKRLQAALVPTEGDNENSGEAKKNALKWGEAEKEALASGDKGELGEEVS